MTTFVDYTTPVTASWLNGVDSVAYTTVPLLVTNNTGTNTGDETTATIKTKLGITTLSGSNTGDQDLSSYLTSATAASTYLTQANAASTYLTISNASSTYAPIGQTMYIGTTSVAINRATGALSLTGVNVDGSSGSCTGQAATVASVTGASGNIGGSSGSCTGNSATATTSSGLTSASTTVSVSGATAPTTGQALIATDSTHATWQTLPSTTPTSGNFTITGTGFTGTVSATAYWRLHNNVVTLSIQPAGGISGTSNAAEFHLTGLPSNLRPTHLVAAIPLSVVNNSSNTSGFMRILTTGAIYLDLIPRVTTGLPDPEDWTASGTKGINTTIITYSLD